MYEQIYSILDKLKTWSPVEVEQQVIIEWSLPASAEHGLFTTNLAFKLTKIWRQSPGQIAEKLVPNLELFIVENALPLTVQNVAGYLNLSLKPEFYSVILGQKITELNALEPDSRKLLLDYVGANVAKRLHAGHMRNLNIGDSLRRLLKLKFPNLVTDNHWGDWGVQFGVMLWGWKQIILGEGNPASEKPILSVADYDQNPIETLTKIYVWSNAQEKKVEGWAELVRQEFFKLEQGDAQNRALWENFVRVSKQEVYIDLDMMNVPALDLEQGESFYEPDMAFLTEFLDQHGIWKIEGQARFFDFEEMSESWIGLTEDLQKKIKNLGRAYLISSSGYTTYCFRDVAARLQWARDLEIEIMVTVADKTQSHNFDQAFAIINYLATLPAFQKTQKESTLVKLMAENLIHVGYGFLSLPDGKMSTRKGNVLSLREFYQQSKQSAIDSLLEKNPELSNADLDYRSRNMALAALKWFDLARDSWGDIVLDISQALKFEGNTGIYQLYTYARLRSILRKATNQVTSSADSSEVSNHLSSAEQQILQQIFIMPMILEDAIKNYKPHLLCNYLYDLTVQINQWYGSTRILQEQNPQRLEQLLQLIRLASVQLKYGLDKLGIEVIEEM